MDNRYSLSYRAAETRQVMDWIKAGQCGSIVGLRGSGKSNFIRFLLRVETQQHYLGQSHTNFIVVPVNLLSLTERTEWGVYEIIFNNLLAQLHPPDMTDEIILNVRTLHQEIMHTRDVLTAQRAMERCMAMLCQQPTRQLVLLFDEFDAVFRDLPATLFRCLRAVRDSYKEQISYLVVATHDLASLRDDLSEEVDHFYRLVTRNPCWLGPYPEADSRQMTGYLASRRALELGEKNFTLLFELSGGHAGLLKTILSLLWNEDMGLLARPAEALAKEIVIERECEKVWGSLSESEKTALFSFSNKNPLDKQTLNHLIARGLIRPRKKDSYVIFSSLLASFVQQQAPPLQQGTYINRSPLIVQIHGQRIKTLTGLESELVCCLYEHHGQVYTKDELVEKIYRRKYDLASDQMLQALVSRARKKIEPDPEHPRYIITVHGEGYKFIVPEDG